MSQKEVINASITLLRARALECYSILKGRINKVPEEGDVDKIAATSLKLAQFESAMTALQTYAESLIEDEEEDEEENIEQNATEPEEGTSKVAQPEHSPTLRRSIERNEKRKND